MAAPVSVARPVSAGDEPPRCVDLVAWVRGFFDPERIHDSSAEWATQGPSVVTVVANGSRQAAAALARAGYGHVRRFVVLPSFARPRWLVPIHSDIPLTKRFAMYTPYTRRARLCKGLIIRGLAPALARAQALTVASRSPLPLERLVKDTTGEGDPVFAASMGTPGPFQKMTVQVMTPQGRIIGYVKLPVTMAAGARLRFEADVLAHLSSMAQLNPHIPRVIHAASWGDGQVLFQSAADGTGGPARFTEDHASFLRTLADVSRVTKRGDRLIEESGREWDASSDRFESGWQDLGHAVLSRAAEILSGREIVCGFGHGDFAPWNTRMAGNRLLVFDWESARPCVPLEWDAFHFRWQVATLLGHDRRWWTEPAQDPTKRALLSLFLLDSARRAVVDENRTSADCGGHRAVLRDLASREARA
jgi:hypothetical protein